MDDHPSYNERLLHWVWENRHFENRRLFTTNNKEIVIYDPGTNNASDGPDFLNARIAIGFLTFYGDIEIHWSPRDWIHHRHHTDQNYNRVILHVVYEDKTHADVYRPDQTAIPTLSIKQHLALPLQKFFAQYQQQNTLPCAGNLSFISHEAFEQQIKKAHKEYFEQKVNDLLQFYDPSLPLSKAWKKLLIIALFDGLGIAHNREPMKKLGAQLFSESAAIPAKQELTVRALRMAGIDPQNKADGFYWKRKGSRPNNHPKHRIAQGCELLWTIKNIPFPEWLRTDIRQSFTWCRQQLEYQPGLGEARASVLWGTVWLPAFYILGDLLANERYTNAAYNAWLNYRTNIPGSVTRLFRQADIPPSTYQQKLGAVHQWRAYCQPGRCEECKVFKDVISS
ncbi:MAG: DUF2851 family protein [Balneolaceae bacterium]|nr:DUF2851 family protein [Balneolaceae bacterium]